MLPSTRLLMYSTSLFALCVAFESESSLSCWSCFSSVSSLILFLVLARRFLFPHGLVSYLLSCCSLCVLRF